MKTIWKYELETTDKQTLSLPQNAQPLCVQTQRGIPCLWVLLRPDNPGETVRRPIKDRTIRIYGTGHPCESDSDEYIGTYQLDGGSLVFHVFQDKE